MSIFDVSRNYDNANGDGNSKPLPHNGSVAPWGHWAAIAMIALSMVTENHGDKVNAQRKWG